MFLSVKNKSYKLLALCLAFVMLFTAAFSVSAAESDTQKLAERLEHTGYDDSARDSLPYYSEIQVELDGKNMDGLTAQRIEGAKYSAFEGKAPSASENGILFSEETDSLTWSFNIAKAGVYNLEVTYASADDAVQAPKRSVYIDGAQTFYEQSVMNLYKHWNDPSAPKMNAVGDEVRVSPVEIKGVFTTLFYDNWSKHATPLKFDLTAGVHTVTLGYISQDVEIVSVGLVPATENKPYAEVSAAYTAEKATETIYFEAEDYTHVDYKSDAVVSIATTGDPVASPWAPTNIRLNVMGGGSWSAAGQEVVWKFNVPKDGLYKINLRTLQNYSDGLNIYRTIKVNGEVPFKELEEYTFPYNKEITSEVISDSEGNPYLFQLKEGENTLSLKVALSDYAELSEILITTSRMLSDMLFDITLITGRNADPNYDYGLDKEIPDLMPRFRTVRENVKFVMDSVKDVSSKRSAMTNNLERIIEELDEVIKKPSSIVQKYDDINTALTDISNYATNLQSSALAIDYIEIAAPEEEIENKKSNFFKRIYATFANFVASFTKDYNAIGSIEGLTEDAETLEVWVALAKEWGQILKELIDSDFAIQNNINVKVNLLPAGTVTTTINPLLLALGSGDAPDVVLGLASTYSVEYAMRNAIYDLSKFDDFDQVIEERFGTGADAKALMTPLEFEGGVYALPMTRGFQTMYYRTDIFEELHLTLPDTWDQLYNDLLPALNQNNMTMFIPQNVGTFLYQMGGSFYRDEGRVTDLDSPIAFKAFDEFCKLYTDYGIPVAEDLYTRFRTGEVPIGIADASFYLKFNYAAPEIADCWAMTGIPGHVKTDANGNTYIDRSNTGIAVDCSVMIHDCENPEAGWKFLKWWTSTEVQKSFAAQVESRIGPTARWLSANKDAFWSLSWTKADKEAVNSVFDWAVETPVVRGGYFSTRHITNAVNSVIVQNEPSRTSLELAVEAINKELERRRKKS